ncbi:MULTISPECIES: choline dehydrogenase [Halomonas]|uniref:choline dehydrogenase n=1 Tax=Halomonas TaxID=2745 RepID=UPI001C970170|nr:MULTISPECIES: choline dehydrogenase [Halomonas]MBY6208630.1 choline dehydrogenase [Halomonas sp. DP3Y7-2]MBY6227101.1 choline dehydrogenase [Halomonas sp. DP3Y7-1]MCA0915150.1 choline dehydrogenase [Halomonas denitrificans]
MKDIYGAGVKDSYDYVVIGSGSAGNVIAARLAEGGSRSVLLLEAGPKDSHIHIRMPAALGFPLMDERFNWNLTSEEETSLNHRKIVEARGRVLGGCSSINGMNWVRGNPADYDGWAKIPGLEHWSYADCLPYFKKSETFDKGENSYRGSSGPMHIETCKADNPLYHAFLEAGVQAGYERVDDHNAFRQEGVHVTQRNVHKGIRWSTSQAYLHNQERKANLQVCERSVVSKIEFEGERAVAVHFDWKDQPQVIGVESEVVLCAGALHSPQILMLSGIGDRDDLAKHGIGSVVHLPGVGRGLKDHVAAPVQYRATLNVSIAKELTLLGKLKIGLLWKAFKKGLGATNFFEVGAFVRTNEKEVIPNVQFEFIPMLGEFQHGSVKLENGFQYFFSLMRPTSEGQVWLSSADYKDAPKFVFNYLATEKDRRDAIDAVRSIRHVIAQTAWDKLRGEEVMPGKEVETDDQILAFLKETAGTNYHPCCTCRMGSDENSVVDGEGRVHGVANLRVVDASIMPEIVSGNLNAPVIMMAEKIADAIKGEAALTKSEANYYKICSDVNDDKIQLGSHK